MVGDECVDCGFGAGGEAAEHVVETAEAGAVQWGDAAFGLWEVVGDALVGAWREEGCNVYYWDFGGG